MPEFYDAGLEGLLDQSLNWLTDDFRVALVQRGYTFNPKHRLFADVAGHVNGTTDPLTGKAITGREGFARGDAYLIASRAAYCDRLVVYRHARNAGEARLLLCAPFAAVHPVAGQRIDIAWPKSLVFGL